MAQGQEQILGRVKSDKKGAVRIRHLKVFEQISK